MKDTKDIISVRNTVKQYIDGTKEANVEKLREVFYENATMTGTLIDNQISCANVEVFLNDIKGKEISSKYNAQIVNIDISENIAIVTMIENELMGLDFMNYFHLQKIENQWKIVSKLFTTL